MKALLFTQPEALELVERPVPQPGSGQVLIRVDAAGICTTDVHIFHGHFAIQPPRVLGHEVTGTVMELGSNVAQTSLGQRVGVQPARFCGHCSACRQDLPELCANFACLGNTQDGGYAEYTIVNADQLVALGSIPTDIGIWLEPLACVLHGLSRVSLRQQRVVIAGAGTFGKLFTQVLARIHNMSAAIVDPNQTRLDDAISMGASHGWQVPRMGPTPELDTEIAAWLDNGPALLIDTTGKGESIERLLRWAAPGSTILLFGVSDPETQISVSPASLFARQLCLTTSIGMAPAAFDAAFRLLQEGRLSLEPLIVARVALAEVPALLPRMPSGKVVIKPQGSDI